MSPLPFKLSMYKNCLSPLLAGVLALLAAAANSQAQSFEVLMRTNLFQPSAVAVTTLNRYIIADSGNHRILEFNPNTSISTVLAGGSAGFSDGIGTDARLRNPQGVAVIDDGIIVADTGNHVIRKVTFDGRVITISGDAASAQEADEDEINPTGAPAVDGTALAARFSSPSALAYDGANTVYIADTGNGRIRALDLTTSEVTTVASGLNRPTGLALGDEGTLFFTDSWLHSVFKLNLGTGGIELLAGRGSAFDSGLRDSANARQALFKAPTALYYRRAQDELIVADTGNGLLRRIFDASSAAPGVNIFANSEAAAFVSPISITREAGGLILVLDSFHHTLTGVIPVQSPRLADPVIGWVDVVTDPDTGLETAILRPVVDSLFRNDVTIVISGDPNGVHHFTQGPGPLFPGGPDTVPVPTETSVTAPNFASPSDPSEIPNSIATPLPSLKIKAVTTGHEGEERVPSRVTEATFRFQVATPVIDSKSSPGALVLVSQTDDAAIWFTVDGSEPVDDGSNPESRLYFEPFPLVVKTNITVKARGYRRGYLSSAVAIAEFSPDSYVPNRISLGFEHGEASSDFVASAGQRFYAPVTLSVLPDTKAYGLQFNLSLNPETNAPVIPNSDYDLRFNSRLMELMPDGYYRVIPNAIFARYETNYVTNVVNLTNFVTVTNVTTTFTNLVFNNVEDRLLGVGWLERPPKTNLFNTKAQHLLSYSFPHDYLFTPDSGKVVPGSFSFRIPSNAPLNATYIVKVDRPSGTVDGVGQDLYIEAPEMDSISPVKAVRRLTVGQRRYIVGDLAPFRWFNAGDFGDQSILNNDFAQMFQSIVYSLNAPPTGSDMEDAMDTCCISTNGVNLANVFDASNGNETLINSIGYGDGELNVADLFVAFRRSLDPSLVWYARYWSNGVRHAEVVPNSFRGEDVPLAASPGPLPPPTPNPGFVKFSIGEIQSAPGQVAVVPVYATISGSYPIRTLLLNLEVKLLDGPLSLDQSVAFTANPALGAPTFASASDKGFTGAWLNSGVEGLSGNMQVGTLHIPVPAGADANSAILVHFASASASPNGLAVLPATTQDGLVLMNGRTAEGWNDSIPNSWRVQYFGSMLNVLSHEEADADGDGVCNRDEFKAGTNPIERQSHLALRAARGQGGKPSLQLPTVVGRKYILEGSASLRGDGWTTIQTDISGTGGTVELSPTGTANHEFFRVRVIE